MIHLFLIINFLSSLLYTPLGSAGKTAPIFQDNPGQESSIVAPEAGQVLQGNIVVRGSTNPQGFSSYEVDFTYIQNPSRGWFLIQESTIPVQDDILAVWDTTTITDGEYSLRLLVTRTDGTKTEIVVSGLRVRNYTPLETATPTAIPPTQIPGTANITAAMAFTSTPIQTRQPPTPTPLPTNPAEISPSRMTNIIGKGIAIALVGFGILGIYLGYRNLQQTQK